MAQKFSESANELYRKNVLREQLRAIKKELGEEAVILSQKTIDAGTARQRVEIMAAMDYDLETVTAPLTKKAQPAPAKKPTIYSYNCKFETITTGIFLASCLLRKFNTSDSMNNASWRLF